MIKFKSQNGFTLFFFIVAFFLVNSCKKDKVPEPIPLPGPTKWEKIAGNYKVYDTLGEFLYEMNISHIHNDSNNTDSLKFENFDGEFTFTNKQEKFSNYPDLLIQTGYHQLLYDSNMYRWKLQTAANDEFYYNVLENDTIRLIFRKTNINYYLLDDTPYFYCECKQIAVKQH